MTYLQAERQWRSPVTTRSQKRTGGISPEPRGSPHGPADHTMNWGSILSNCEVTCPCCFKHLHLCLLPYTLTCRKDFCSSALSSSPDCHRYNPARLGSMPAMYSHQRRQAGIDADKASQGHHSPFSSLLRPVFFFFFF